MHRIALTLIIFFTFSNLTLAQTDADLPDASEITWHPSGEYVAIAGVDGLWLYTVNFDLIWFNDLLNINEVQWSNDGSMMLLTHKTDVNTFEQTVTRIDFSSDMEIIQSQRILIGEFENEYTLFGMTWHPESTKFAIVDEALDILRIYDVDGTELLTIQPDYDLTNAVDWHPTENIIAVEARAEGISMWNTETGDFIRLLPYSDEGLLSSGIHFNSSGNKIVAGTVIPASVHVWDTETGDFVFPPDTSGDVSLVRLTRWSLIDDFILYWFVMAQSCRFGGVVLMNTSTWAHEDEINTPLDSCSFDVELTPDGEFITALSFDGYLYQWEIGTERPIKIEKIQYETLEIQF